MKYKVTVTPARRGGWWIRRFGTFASARKYARAVVADGTGNATVSVVQDGAAHAMVRYVNDAGRIVRVVI